MEPPPTQRNETLRSLHLICQVLYLTCGQNLWFQDLNYPKRLMKVHESVSKFIDVFLLFYVLSQLAAFYTQTHLNEQQAHDVYLFSFSHVLFYVVYTSIVYYKEEMRELLHTLSVKLKEEFNDAVVDKLASRAARRFLLVMVFISIFMVAAYGINSGVQALTTNATFVTLIPVWPDVEDRRVIAGVARILHYCMWWIYATRIFFNTLIILTIISCLAHQFANLYKYFESLNSIFDGTGSQADKEKQFEDAFKVGIKMHSLTLWCSKQAQTVGSVAFGAQLVVNYYALVVLDHDTNRAERTFITLLPIAFMMLTLMFCTGIFMCNAGDVTFEASKLPTAMFNSGWHNCQRESSVRVRKLVTIAIAQAQQRVVIKGLGRLELSYETYVQIVKLSYSLFSVIY